MGLMHTMRTAKTNLGKKWAVSAFPRCSRQKTSNTTTSRTPSKIASSTTEAEVLPYPERYTVPSGLGHANICCPGCSSPSSDLRIRRVSRAMPPGSKAPRAPGLIRNPFAWIRRMAGD